MRASHDAFHMGEETEHDDELDAKKSAISRMKQHIGVEDDEDDYRGGDVESPAELQSPGYSMKYKRKDKKKGGGGMGGGMGGMDISSIAGMMG